MPENSQSVKESNDDDEKSTTSHDDNDKDAVRLLDFTTASLGAILIVLCGIFIHQAGALYDAYLDLTDLRLEGRGVARIRLGQEGVDAEMAAFVERNEPFLCRKCLKDTLFWQDDANIVETVGKEAILQVRIANRTTDKHIPTHFRRDAAPGTRGEESAYHEENMTIIDFMKSYNNPDSKEHLYAAQINVASALPGLIPRIKQTAPPANLLEAVGTTPARSQRPISIYLGTGPLTTQIHYDSLENVVCVASGGRKIFRLFDPPTSSLLLYADRTKYGNGSPVPPDEPSFKEFPMAKYALPIIVQLDQGDCLYLPVYWYHSVTTSAERTVSINWWRKPVRNKMITLEGLFCGKNQHGSSATC